MLKLKSSLGQSTGEIRLKVRYFRLSILSGTVEDPNVKLPKYRFMLTLESGCLRANFGESGSRIEVHRRGDFQTSGI